MFLKCNHSLKCYSVKSYNEKINSIAGGCLKVEQLAKSQFTMERFIAFQRKVANFHSPTAQKNRYGNNDNLQTKILISPNPQKN